MPSDAVCSCIRVFSQCPLPSLIAVTAPAALYRKFEAYWRRMSGLFLFRSSSDRAFISLIFCRRRFRFGRCDPDTRTLSFTADIAICLIWEILLILTNLIKTRKSLDL